MKIKKDNKAYISIYAVIIIGAIAMSVVFATFSIVNSFLKSSRVKTDSKQALALTDACAEKALQEIRDNNAFHSSGEESLDTGDCSYDIVNNGSSDIEIQATSNVNETTKRVRVKINQVVPQINIVSWQEVADF